MKCFGFSYLDEGLSIPLCQEIVEYHTTKVDGIPITGNIVVKSLDDKEKRLGIWHRADVYPFDVGETAKWLDCTDLYTYVFFNLVENRGQVVGPSTIEARLFDEKNRTNPRLHQDRTRITVPSMQGKGQLTLSYPVWDELRERGLPLPESRFVPYTYAEIGPFAGRDRYFAIRVRAEITGDSFERLVAENPLLGTRYYEVYGINEIMEKIENLDLPLVRQNCDELVFNTYSETFKHKLRQKVLTPDFYSIVAIDSRDSDNYAPHRVYSIHLKRALREYTDAIHPSLFAHERLRGLEGRVFWFVNRERRQDFHLWLEGPMAEAHADELVGAATPT